MNADLNVKTTLRGGFLLSVLSLSKCPIFKILIEVIFDSLLKTPCFVPVLNFLLITKPLFGVVFCCPIF